ncbi:MAG: GNAT family N-acetyltransferase [Elusimicrobiota bacterium]
MDLLVKLYGLPGPRPLPKGVVVRRALAPEKRLVCGWVAKRFSEGWASECDVAFSRKPVSLHVAVRGGKLLGFSVHGVYCLDFFGPAGVAPAARGKGLGRELLLASLKALEAQGYAYAFIGGAGPVDFYAKSVGAVPIAGSTPGPYRGLLSVSRRRNRR